MNVPCQLDREDRRLIPSVARSSRAPSDTLFSIDVGSTRVAILHEVSTNQEQSMHSTHRWPSDEQAIIRSKRLSFGCHSLADSPSHIRSIRLIQSAWSKNVGSGKKQDRQISNRRAVRKNERPGPVRCAFGPRSCRILEVP